MPNCCLDDAPEGPDASCDDGDACTRDYCVRGVRDGWSCRHLPVEGACAAPVTCGASGACPPLFGYEVACNAQDHCEYRAEDAVGWRTRDVLVWVPPGTSPMGAPESEHAPWALPRHDVSFADGFWVDKLETTTAAYAAFLEARGHNTCGHQLIEIDCLDPPDSLRLSWTGDEAVIHDDCPAGGPLSAAGLPGCADHPIVETSWYGAQAFCTWRGAERGEEGRWGLCSEAQWERAAAGETAATFPWAGGDTPAFPPANCREDVCEDGFEMSAPVGSFPGGVSPVGCHDMAGNVLEWVADPWHPSYDGAPADGSSWAEAPAAEDRRVFRGGDWLSDEAGLETWRRYPFPASLGGFNLGLRCCRTP